MDKEKDPRLSPEEALRAENNLLKLKLSMEHGMHEMGDADRLSPEVENQWLKQVYAFEQQYKDAKAVKLYDYLGRPEFIKWDALTPELTSKELKRIRSIMAANNVELDCIWTYDDAVIYKFITEELFQHEIDDLRLPGMVHHYIYEEFHPNHDYDLRRAVHNFLNCIFERSWNEEFDDIALAPSVTFSGNYLSRHDISAIIKTFQEAHHLPVTVSLNIADVDINSETTQADVRGAFSASAKRQSELVVYEGNCSFHFVRTNEFWYIDSFHMPGLG